jgi:hypothetical protein
MYIFLEIKNNNISGDSKIKTNLILKQVAVYSADPVFYVGLTLVTSENAFSLLFGSVRKKYLQAPSSFRCVAPVVVTEIKQK